MYVRVIGFQTAAGRLEDVVLNAEFVRGRVRHDQSLLRQTQPCTRRNYHGARS